MKRFLVDFLVALLLASLMLSCAVAETDVLIEFDMEPDAEDIQLEIDDSIPEDVVPSLDDIELQELGDIEDLMLDAPQEEEAAPIAATGSDAVPNDGGAEEDFEIINGILVKYNGPGGDVVIPDSVNSIGSNAFSQCSSLTSISIPKSVTRIGDSAFYYCPSLTSISIPNSVTSIGSNAFCNCTSLTSVSIPNSVTSIGSYAFGYCSSLTSISIPNSVTSIGDSAFTHCTRLTSVSLPNSVTSIGGYAFEHCTRLTSVSLPNSVTSIGRHTFNNCSRLTSVSIPDSVKKIGDFAFYNCSSLTSVSLPNSVTSIGRHAFSSCSSLASVSIPDSVKQIGDHVFNNCSSLTGVSIPNSVTSIGSSVFAGCSNLEKAAIGKGVSYINSETFSGCKHLKSIVLPSGITGIGSKAFDRCYSLTDVTIKNGDISISNVAFTDCPLSMIFHTPCESKATKWAEAEGYTVIKSDHTPVTDNAVAATCTKAGKTQGSHCSVCGAILTAQQVKPATGHSWKTPTYTWSSDNKSVTAKRVCAHDTSHVQNETVKTTSAVALSPTCTAKGKTTYTAKYSNSAFATQKKTVTNIAAKGHTAVSDKAVAPTVTKTGLTQGSHCSVCGKVLVPQKTVAKLISVKKCVITGISSKVYTGSVIKPVPVVKYNGKTLVSGTDYTVSYASNKAIGTATVKITGKGKYGESVSKTFSINPKAVALSSLTAGTKQLTVKWEKGTGINGYQVQYSLKSDFASPGKVTIKTAGTVQTVIKKLTANTTYYVRIRAYRTVNEKNYYSAWSKAKSAKVK